MAFAGASTLAVGRTFCRLWVLWISGICSGEPGAVEASVSSGGGSAGSGSVSVVLRFLRRGCLSETALSLRVGMPFARALTVLLDSDESPDARLFLLDVFDAFEAA